MPLISATSRTLQIKVVYYGPGLSGKTTNLEQLAAALDPERIGDLMSLDTTGDRTLFFDWMPLELGKIKGFDVKIQLFTVPGQVRYNNTRKKVLQGVDGLVFVADSQEEAVEQNRISFQNLRENLAEQGIDLEDLPLVIQWNKRDLPTALPPAVLAERLNLEHYPQVSAVASKCEGVRETLRLIAKLSLNSVRHQLDPDATLPDESEQMPLDGDSLMERIMSGDDGDDAPPAPGLDSEAELPEILEDSSAVADGGLLLGDDDETPTMEVGAVSVGLAVVQRELRALAQAVRQVRETLPVRVADAVEREVEPTTAKVADIESRLGIMQRVVTRLGGRVDVLERRVARLEIQDRQPSRSAELKEMAGHVHDLSRLMAAFARRLRATGGDTPGGGAPDDGRAEPAES